MKNRHEKHAKISEEKFRIILRAYALDIPALSYIRIPISVIGAFFVTTLCIAGFSSALAQTNYLFLDFESASDWPRGAISEKDRAIVPLQGLVTIAEFDKSEPHRVLQLGSSADFPAAFVDANPIRSSPMAYCEVLVKPFALREEQDNEFLDFGGAVIGFYRKGIFGEVHVLSAKSETESVWIATGIQVPLSEQGVALEWLQLEIALDRVTGRWNLTINQQQILSGLRIVSTAQENSFGLWLYGEADSITWVDDILLSEIPPTELEREQQEHASRFGTISSTGSKIVTKLKNDHSIRQTRMPAPAREAASAGTAVLRGWHLVLNTGTRDYSSSKNDSSRAEPKIIAYSPEYNEDDTPKPIRITINADVELRPGTDLSRIRWKLSELKGWPNNFGAEIASGNFASGLVQTCEIPSEWARKATSVLVWTE